MYVDAIERVDQFTKPIHTISRTYGGLLSPGTSTLFFVNEFGVAITCKHVMELIVQSDGINNHYNHFKQEASLIPRDGKYKDGMRALEKKYQLKSESTIQIKNQFVNSVDHIDNIIFHAHPTLDLAIAEFKGFKTKNYSGHATFIKNPEKVKQGKALCRLGYPFPEFTNFSYNSSTDDIEWTQSGNPNSPKFPLDGIITRFGADASGIISIEMSTPGLRGQSGGPLFDADGLIYGMQFMTSHLHLGFDIHNMEIMQDGKRNTVSNSPFLHVGHCIHVNRITEFLRQHNIKYYEG